MIIKELLGEVWPEKRCHYASENGAPFETEEDKGYNSALEEIGKITIKVVAK